MVKLAHLAEMSKQLLKECLVSVGLVTTTDLQRVETRLDDLLDMVEDLQSSNPPSATSKVVVPPFKGSPPQSTNN